LKAKVIRRPWRFSGPLSGVNLVWEDKNGDLVRGIFYNSANKEDSSKLEEVFDSIKCEFSPVLSAGNGIVRIF